MNESSPVAGVSTAPDARLDGGRPAADRDAVQSFETAGLAPLTRPGLPTRAFVAAVAWVEWLNRRFAVHGNPCVYDDAAFPWKAELETHWRTIRAELDAVLARRAELPGVHEIAPDAVSINRDAGWKVLVLTGYGIDSPPGIAWCPRTWAIVARIPGLRTAMFSILEPGKRIPPHRGPYNGVLRLHLGLKVAEPRELAGIRIGHERRHWQEGRVLIFDDAYEHEAWNDTGAERVVLFVDFAKPLRFPANLVNRLFLGLAAFTPFLRESAARLRRWERAFYGTGKTAGTGGST